MEIKKAKQTAENLCMEKSINFKKKRLKTKDKSKKIKVLF